jgi:hypothetical protein
VTTDVAVQDATRDVVVADREQAAGALQQILATGDLSILTNEQRVAYYLKQCASLGLNPISRPFDWIWFKEPSGEQKLALYPNQSAAAQLRRNHQISARIIRREVVGELFVVEAEGMTPNGRIGQATKYVSLTNKYGRLTGTLLANAFMRAETGALRRLTLSMVGLSSPPDPDELHGSRPVIVDGTGKMLEHPTPEQKALAAHPRMAEVLGEPTYESTAEASGAGLGELDGMPSQAPTIDELEPARRPAERQSFRPSKEQVDRWLGAWFAAVKGTSVDTDEARHRFAAEYTKDWPENLRTSSLRTLFGHCTERQAADILARIRALAAAEVGDDPDWHGGGSRDPGEAPSGVDRRVHDAVVLTGGGHASGQADGSSSEPSSEVAEPEPAAPIRPDPEGEYTRKEWLQFYADWSAYMKRLDVHWKPTDVKRLPDAALREAVLSLVDEAVALDRTLSRFEADDEEDEDDQSEPAF